MDEDIARWRKKSQKKPPKKADHKHQYAECVLEYTDERFTKERGMVPEKRCSLGSYCTICGKIGEIEWYMGWLINNRRHSEEEAEKYKREMNPETRTLPTFWIDDYFKTKYVELRSDETELL